MIKNDIQREILTSLKEKRVTELKVLRFILSEIKYAEINKQKDLPDEEITSLLQKEVKKRKEAIEMFKKGGRTDIVADEVKQIAIIEAYLPKQMSNEELNKIIGETLAGLEDKSNIGKVIGAVIPKVKGRADGARVVNLVKRKLGLS